MSRPALQLAANQGMMLVLSMVVVGGLVGARGARLRRRGRVLADRRFGMGLAAGIALVLLGIMLDRITQGAATRGRGARQG